MRVTVPPRELAATITARSVLRTGWAIAIAYLGISAIMLVEHGLSRENPGSILPAFCALLAILGAILFVMARPSPRRGVLFLAVGTVGTFVFSYVLLLGDPNLNTSGSYLVNRLGIVVLLIGPVGVRLIDGAWWCTAGYLLGFSAIASAQWALGLEVRPGAGPLIALAIYLAVILTFVIIRRRQRRYVPDFSAIEVETARMSGQRELEERAVAILHDTILNDLTAVASGKAVLDDRSRARIARDLATVSATTVSAATVDATRPVQGESDAADDSLRDGMLGVINDFQWRGLRVDVTGGGILAVRLSEPVRDAVIGAVRSCLDNVVQHSGSSSAEVFFDTSGEQLSVMVVDQGSGFDPDAVRNDRLGIRRSIITRIENCGGAVRLWSTVGAGTSVVMTVPLGSGEGAGRDDALGSDDG